MSTKRWLILGMMFLMLFLVTGCDELELDSNTQDVVDTKKLSMSLVEKYPTPTDVVTSLSRYNLIRRAYYMAGNLEKAKNYPSDVEKPVGYIYLFVEGVGCIKCDRVDGIVTSMRSYLTPDSTAYAGDMYKIEWLADVDGTYGENVDGIFYFDTEGEYHEWLGPYYYSKKYYDLKPLLIEAGFEAE